MSYAALAWAARQKLPCSQKMVLLMLANRHNSDNGRCDPSHDRLAGDCGLTRRSVIDQIAKLSEAGFIRIRHRALGNKKLANQYTLVLSFGAQEEIKDPANFAADDDLRGSEARSLPSQKVVKEVHCLVNDVHQGSKGRSHKPVNESVKEPEEKKARERAALQLVLEKPEDVTLQTWVDWLQLRKGKGAAVTQTVVNEARREADKAGLPLERFLAIWCLRGSQGLEASWLKPSERDIAAATTLAVDPDAQSAVEAEGIAKGIGPWNQLREQWSVYKARVRGLTACKPFDQNALASLAVQGNGIH
jgi:hypothetical protein